MSIHNSAAGSNEEDSEITIIHPSITDEHNEYVNNTYVPIITRLRQANNSSENRQITNSRTTNNNNNNNIYPSSVGENSFIFVEHDPLKNAKDLEQVLHLYIGDLKQENNTQLNCDKQLTIRLMGLIRSAYSNNQQKMGELDKIMEDIGLLHDKRHVEQNEKMEKLRAEACRLNGMLLTASNNYSMYDENNRNYSIRTIHPHSFNDYDQWTEIEDDAKKLHGIIQTQKNQINEIVTLISETEIVSSSLDRRNVPIDDNEDTMTGNPTTPNPNINRISSLLERITQITGSNQPVTVDAIQETVTVATQQKPVADASIQVPVTIPAQKELVTVAPIRETILVNHSPGTSSSQSSSTFVVDSFTPTIVNQTESVEELHDRQIDTHELIPDEPRAPIDIPITPPAPIDIPIIPPAPIDIPITPPAPIDIPIIPPAPIDIPITLPVPQTEAKKCPVCNYAFPFTLDDVEMYDHIDKCLFPTPIDAQPQEPKEPEDYECPKCNQKFTGNDEFNYIQHLSDCYNRDF